MGGQIRRVLFPAALVALLWVSQWASIARGSEAAAPEIHSESAETSHEKGAPMPHLYNFFAPVHAQLQEKRLLPAWLSGENGEQNFTMAVNSLLVMFALMLLWNRMRSKGELRPSPWANAGEWLVETIYGLIVQFSSERTARKYFPWLASFFIYILALNLWGLIPGFHTPTSIYNTTLSFAILSVTTSIFIAIRETGIVGFVKHLAGDTWWLSPLMLTLGIIEQIARTLSLSLRLFGNMFGEDVAIAIFASLGVAWFVPLQAPIMVMHLLFSVIQAMIFTALSASYIEGFTHAHEGPHEHVPGHPEGVVHQRA
ncbi:MAG: F0F1 ATP synthase subunit A [bacterium]